jgi:hypothetical protein
MTNEESTLLSMLPLLQEQQMSSIRDLAGIIAGDFHCGCEFPSRLCQIKRLTVIASRQKQISQAILILARKGQIS